MALTREQAGRMLDSILEDWGEVWLGGNRSRGVNEALADFIIAVDASAREDAAQIEVATRWAEYSEAAV